MAVGQKFFIKIVMRKLLNFEVKPSWAKLPGLLKAALKS